MIANEYNTTKLFKSIWNNIYLRKYILKYLQLYNIFYSSRSFKNIQKFKEFKNKEYLFEIEIQDVILNLEYELNQLPSNIQSVAINIEEEYSFKIPESIKNLTIKSEAFEQFNSLSTIFRNTLIERLCLCYYHGVPSLNESYFPTTLTHLDIYYFNKIVCGTFPNTLTKLEITIDPSYEIEIGALPESLTYLIITYSVYQQKKQLLPLNSNIFPSKSLKTLMITCEDTLRNSIKLDQDFKLPNSLTNLQIHVESVSNGLTSLPSNLIKLESKLNDTLFISLPNNLKELIVLEGSDSTLSPNILPPNLTRLEFSELFVSTISFFNNGGISISSYIFPQTITYLNLGHSFNTCININVLPTNLKYLFLGTCFNQPINKDSIPTSLKRLTIKNKFYSHFPIQLNNNNTIIDCTNYFKQFQNMSTNELYNLKITNNDVIGDSNKQLLIDLLSVASNLNYLEIGYTIHQKIPFNQLIPPLNNIRVLVLTTALHEINLDHFRNLEILNIKLKYSLVYLYTSSNNNSDNNSLVQYNFYNLKIIKIPITNNKQLDIINPIFYNFIKLKNK